MNRNWFFFLFLHYCLWGSLRASVCPCILGRAYRSIWLSGILLSCQAENWHEPLKAILMFYFMIALSFFTPWARRSPTWVAAGEDGEISQAHAVSRRKQFLLYQLVLYFKDYYILENDSLRPFNSVLVKVRLLQKFLYSGQPVPCAIMQLCDRQRWTSGAFIFEKI